MKKILIVSLLTLFFTICFNNGNTYAQDNLNVNIESKSNFIELSWNDVAINYELNILEDDGNLKKVWEGNETKFLDTKLESDTPYTYKLYAKDENGNEISNVTINTSTQRDDDHLKYIQNTNARYLEIDDNPIYYPMLQSNVNIVYNNDRLVLSWEGIPSDNNIFEIHRNGEYLTSIHGDEFIDYDIKKNEVYHYSVIGSKKIPNEKIVQKKKDLQKSGMNQLSLEEEKVVYYEPKTASAVVRISDERVLRGAYQDKSLIANKNDSESRGISYPNGYGYLLRYTTFIPLDYADNPYCNVKCVYKYFGGDGEHRGFNAWSDKFRTRLDAYVTWNNSGSPQGVTVEPQTGITYGYDANKKLIGSAKAPAVTDHKVWAAETGNGWIYHRGSVASSNPLTTAPDIDAFYYAKVWQNGKSEFYGVHDQAPSHEFYIMGYPGDFDVPIIQHTHKGFEYLFPYMPSKEWQVNFY